MIQGVLSDDKGIKLEIDNRFLEKVKIKQSQKNKSSQRIKGKLNRN